MLEEEGIVKTVFGDKAIVLTERKGECAHCVAKKACYMLDEGNEVLAQVLNPVGAEAGDRVKIAIQSGAILKSSFILYLFPALGLIMGSALGYYLGKSYDWNLDLSALFCGLITLGLSFLIVFILNHHLKKGRAYWPQIQAIIPKEAWEKLADESDPNAELQ